MKICGVVELQLHHSWSRHEMEVSGKIHNPSTLQPGKGIPVPVAYEAGWIPESVWTLWRIKYIAPTGNRIPTIQSVAISAEASVSLLNTYTAGKYRCDVQQI